MGLEVPMLGGKDGKQSSKKENLVDNYSLRESFKHVLEMRIKKALQKVPVRDQRRSAYWRIVSQQTLEVYCQLEFLQRYCEEHPPHVKTKNTKKAVYWPDEKYKNVETPVLSCHTFERYLDEEEEEFPEEEDYPGNRDEEDLYT